VAKEILKDMRMLVDVAGNGMEALRLAERKQYDAILMDLQMPVMDGFEAARRIRELKHGKEMPIIAMTADAMKGVKEQVVEAGMDSYITKPFDPIQLFGILQRLIQTSKVRGLKLAAEASGFEPIESAEEPAAVLQAEAAIRRLGGNVKLYREILQLFLANHAGAVQEIGEALRSGQREKAVRAAHTLKGVASQIGADELHRMSERLQNELQHEAEAAAVSRMLEEAEAQLRAVLTSIDRMLRKLG
jgi:CheY-like chemotaxis protein